MARRLAVWSGSAVEVGSGLERNGVAWQLWSVEIWCGSYGAVRQLRQGGARTGMAGRVF